MVSTVCCEVEKPARKCQRKNKERIDILPLCRNLVIEFRNLNRYSQRLAEEIGYVGIYRQGQRTLFKSEKYR
jgi:hypothetical protein